MNSRTTWWLMGIALALLAFILLVEQRGPGPARNGQKLPLLANFEPNHVANLEINWTNQSIRAERAGVAWRLAAPPYPAQPGSVEGFLQKLATVRQLAVISPNEVAAQTNGRTAFGLDPPRATVTLQADTNLLTIHIGGKTLIGDQVYVQIAGQPTVQVTEGELFTALPGDTYAWRDPRLIYLESKIDLLAITNAGRGFQIQLDPTNQIWKLVSPLTARADLRRFNQLKQQLEHTRISRFVTDDAREDLDRFGLQNPEVQLALTFATNEVLHLLLGKSPTNDVTQVYAKRRGAPSIFLVPKEGLFPLLTQPYPYYRDHQFISLASLPAITRVEGRTDKDEFVIERRGTNAWQIVSPFDARADTELVKRFFGDLHRLEIVDFASDLAVPENLALYRLDAPARQYALKSTATNAVGLTNALVARLHFSAPGTNEVDRVSAHRSDEPSSVYTVKYGDVAQLPKAAFELRDRQLWNFDETNVVSVMFTTGGKTNELVRDSARGWAPDQILHEQRSEAIHRLGRVRVVGWTGRGEEQIKGFPMNRQVEVVTLVAGQRKTFAIQFGGIAAGGTGVYASAVLDEGRPVLFVFPYDQYNYLLTHLSLGAEATLGQ